MQSMPASSLPTAANVRPRVERSLLLIDRHWGEGTPVSYSMAIRALSIHVKHEDFPGWFADLVACGRVAAPTEADDESLTLRARVVLGVQGLPTRELAKRRLLEEGVALFDGIRNCGRTTITEICLWAGVPVDDDGDDGRDTQIERCAVFTAWRLIPAAQRMQAVEALSSSPKKSEAVLGDYLKTRADLLS
jgi:hypothetical protein